MKYILLTIFTYFLPTVVLAQESSENVNPVEFEFWQILLAFLAPLTFILIGYLLIKKFKL